MGALPTGMVTFLFTDVEGSTRLWEEHPAAMRQALTRHDALIETVVAGHQGVVVRPRGEGDSRFAVFARATDAVAAAVAIQQALHSEVWPDGIAVSVRVVLHTGEADLREGDYYGSAVNRCARLRGIAHGGQALLSQVTYDLVRDVLPAGVSLRNLGEHRLRDLQRKEQVFQLLAAGVPTDFPPLRSLDTVPHNLPLQVTSFVGREQVVTELCRLLERSPLLTLTGPGGTGKTRLAMHLAAASLERYPQGVWLIELAPVVDPSLVPGTLATVLGIREDASRPLLGLLAEVLRPKHLLLILDNCEHLLDTCAHVADALIRACPHVQIVATSREALGIAGETIYRVPSLTLPDTQQALSPETLSRSEAVRLFMDRAGSGQPHFTLTPANAPAVAQVCLRLDGIPLALEMAAARVRVLGVEQVAARLGQRFRLLTGGSRTALPRQQTLQATVDWSYSLLSSAEQIVFTRLSIFAGGWSLEAAEAVCVDEVIKAEDVLDLLLKLVEKSLVVAEEIEGGTTRYRLLETLRQYGRERLVAGDDTAALHARHAAYYLALAEQADQEQNGPEQVYWLAVLEREHDNLRVSLAWYLDQATFGAGDDGTVAAEHSLRLAGAVAWFWYLHCYLREGLHWLDQALARSAGSPPILRAKALHGAGHLAWLLNDMPRRQELLAQALALYRDHGSTRDLVLALAYMGLTACESGHGAEGAQLLDESLSLARAQGTPQDVAYALIMSSLAVAGTVAIHEDTSRARAWAAGEEGLRIVQSLGDTKAVGYVQSALGRLALYEGKYERAREAITGHLVAVRAVGFRFGITDGLIMLGDIAHQQGDRAGAAAFYEEALAVYHSYQGDPHGMVGLISALAEVALAQGDWPQAQRYATDGLMGAWELGESDLSSVAQALEAQAALLAARGDAYRALCLMGAAATVRAWTSAPLWPFDKAALERLLVATREPLSADQQALAWAEGEAMTLEQAITYALEVRAATTVVREG